MNKLQFYLLLCFAAIVFDGQSKLLYGQKVPGRNFLYKTKFDTTSYQYGSHIDVKYILPKSDQLISLDIDDRDKIGGSNYTRSQCIEILGEYLTFQDDTTKSNKKYNFRAGYHLVPPTDTIGFTIQIEALFSFTWMLTQGLPPIRPTLVNRITGEHLNKDAQAIKEVFAIYKKWYEADKKTNFISIKLPLEGTPYAWLGEEKGLKPYFKTTFQEDLLEKQ